MDLSIIDVDFRALRPLLNSIKKHLQIIDSLLESSSSHPVFAERVRALMALPIPQRNVDVRSKKFMDLIQDLLRDVQAAIESRDDLIQKAKVLTEYRNVRIQEVQWRLESTDALRPEVQSLLKSRDDLRYEILVLLEFTHVLKLEVRVLKDFKHALRLEVNAANGRLSQRNMNDWLADRLVPVLELYCDQLQDLDNTMKELKDKMAHHPVPEELNPHVPDVARIWADTT